MLDVSPMHTSLELDEDIVAAAKELARKQGVTLGRLISELARKSLSAEATPKVRNGLPLFSPNAVTPRPGLQVVNELRDE